jgi:hypothetical protein
MRGQDQSSSSPFGYVDPESRVPARHAVRPVGEMPGVTPHVAENAYDPGRAGQKSAFDGPTARHPSYAIGRRRGPAL